MLALPGERELFFPGLRGVRLMSRQSSVPDTPALQSLLLQSVLTAVSDRRSSGIGEAGRPWQVVGEPPELDVEWGIECPDLATLLFVEKADLKTVIGGLFFLVTLVPVSYTHLTLPTSDLV